MNYDSRGYDNGPLYAFLMLVGLVITLIVWAKFDYEYRKQIVRDAIEESKQEPPTP